jgi:hypothetical protein
MIWGIVGICFGITLAGFLLGLYLDTREAGYHRKRKHHEGKHRQTKSINSDAEPLIGGTDNPIDIDVSDPIPWRAT